MADFWDEMYLDEHLVDLDIDASDNFSALAALAGCLEKISVLIKNSVRQFKSVKKNFRPACR